MSQSILLVDDDSIILELVRSILERAGYDVVSANCGEEALSIAQGDPRICLVLSDIVMPGISGIELCKRLKMLRPELRCILMSGYNMGLLVSDWDAYFLPKPFFPEDLVGKVKEVLALQTC
jgi:CheY-like chemotaxis protein